MAIDDWKTMGLIAVQGGSATALLKLFPYRDLIVGYDLPRRLLTPQGEDYVMGIGGSSLTLANLTIRRRSELTLDLGTGCGIQALLAVRHSDRVVAVDRNPRAIAVAPSTPGSTASPPWNAVRETCLLPWPGMTFDLIVSNPPFVISPESRYIYRDSGLAGDEICRNIAREAPRFLNEGGFCQILCNWAEFAGQDWRERLREWFDGSGCDVWVMRNQSRDVATYAATWLRHTEKLETEDLSGRFKEWLSYYDRHAIEQIGGGVITLRRHSGCRNWFRADDGLETMFGTLWRSNRTGIRGPGFPGNHD